MSEEIEHRLELSLAFTQYLRHEWGDDIFRIAQASAGSLSFIEDRLGVDWISDDRATDLFQRTAAEIIRNYRDQKRKGPGRSIPQGSFDDKSPDELARMFAALGGLPPPRVKRKPVEIEIGEDEADG